MEEKDIKGSELKVIKGVNPIVVIFLSLILVVGCGFGGWYLGTQYANKEDKNNNTKVEETNKKDETSKEENKDENKPAKSSKYTFKKEKTLKLDYTNEKTENIFNVVAYYYVDKERLVYVHGENIDDYYVVRRDVFVNGKSVSKDLVIDATSEESNVDKIIENDKLVVNPMKDKVDDNSYLVLNLVDHDYLVDGDEIGMRYDHPIGYSFVINKEGFVLGTIKTNTLEEYLYAIFANKSDIGDRKSYKFSEIEYFDSVSDLEDYGEDRPTTHEYAIYANDNKIDVKEDFLYYVENYECSEECYREHIVYVSEGILKDEFNKPYCGVNVIFAGNF